MNEQIKELAKEAGAYFGGGTTDYFGDYLPPYMSITDLDLKKFAELIIRECGYHADVFESLGCPVDMDPTETKPSDYIKKHFGVEE